MKAHKDKALAWNASLPVRSILIMMVVLVFLAVICIVLFVRNYVKQVNREMKVLYSNTADAYVTAVGDKLSNYDIAMGSVSLNQTIRENIFRTDISRSEMVEIGNALGTRIDEMTFFLYHNAEVQSHYLYTYLPANGRYFLNITDANNQPWYSLLQEQSSCWCYTYSNVTRSNHLTLASTVNAFGASIENQGKCYQTISIDTAQLFAPSAVTFPDMNAEIFILDDKSGEVIYASDKKLTKSISALYKTQSMDRLPNRVTLPKTNGESFIPIFRSMNNLDASVVLLFRPAKIVKQGDPTNLFLLVVASASFLVFLFVLLLFYYMFAQRMESLITKMDRFDEKEPSHPEAIGGNDEIARIDRHLIKMQERIRTLIQEEYTATLQKMKAQHEALIACINPHFLYNTLNSISAMACMEGSENTVNMIDALSNMFRYSSDVSEKHVTLRAELQNISDYLYIQGIRYQNSFAYKMEVDQELQDCLVPKLILQPIVENAFKHGFREQYGGASKGKEVRISARANGETVIISICDNGVGMSPERLEALQKWLNSPSDIIEPSGSARYGLRNVNQRIRMICGDDCGLSISIQKSGYTCVEVTLNLVKPEISSEHIGVGTIAENLCSEIQEVNNAEDFNR